MRETPNRLFDRTGTELVACSSGVTFQEAVVIVCICWVTLVDYVQICNHFNFKVTSYSKLLHVDKKDAVVLVKHGKPRVSARTECLRE